MPFLHDVAKFLVVAQVDLVDEQQHGNLHLAHFRQEIRILLRIFDHVRDIEQHVGIGQGTLREGQHQLLHLVVGLQHARRVAEDDLHIVRVDDAHDAVSGGLRLERGDADTLAHKLVHQRGLADVRVSYDIYESCFMHISSVVLLPEIYLVKEIRKSGSSRR